MTKKRRKPEIDMNKAAEILYQRLIFLISFLGVSVTILIFRVGENWWPIWIVDYRSRIIGILLLVLVIVLVSSPLIIESAQRPRDFPGPGKNPYIDP
jgi:pilus assembly protein TadC